MLPKGLILCLLSLVFASCLPAKFDPAPQNTPPVAPRETGLAPSAVPDLPPPAESATSPAAPASLTPSPGGQAPDVSILPRPHYTISATLNYAEHHLAVDERIAYTNRSSDALNELVLMVDPLYFPGAFRLGSLKWDDGQAIQNYSLDNAQIRIPMPEALSPGESTQLGLTYELDLPSPTPSAEVRPIPFGYTSHQANLVDWYPFVAPYRSGEGWLANHAGYFGEHLVYEMADFDVEIYLTDQRDDLIIAASSPATPTDAGNRAGKRYQMENARNFAWSVSPEYQVDTRQVGDVTVSAYTLPVHANAGKAVLQTTSEALEYYSNSFAPYPHKALSVVEADFLDGMEYDGLYFLSKGFYNLFQGTPGEYLIAIAAHETAHQWWYGMVGNDQANEPWLDEALSTFSELLYFEHFHPEAVKWWWDYRMNYYNPRGWVDGSIYNPEGYRTYRDAVYLNGANFLFDLRELIGKKNFEQFIRDYVQSETNQIATGIDFFRILRAHAQTDIAPLVNQYFKASF